MKLLNLQRRMARAVMTPLTRSERMRAVAPDGRSMRAVAIQIIKPNDRLTSFERLEIYNRQYWFRVLSGFAEDFPGLRAVLGGRRFDAMAKAYLMDCPSQSFTLRNLRFAPGELAAKNIRHGPASARNSPWIWHAWNGPISKPSTAARTFTQAGRSRGRESREAASALAALRQPARSALSG